MDIETNLKVNTFLCLSNLLDYPQSLEHIQTWQKNIADILPETQATVYKFCEQAKSMSLSKLQEEYVDIFDLAKQTSPYLTWHMYGDHKNQGKALVALNELYKDVGFKASNNELPDYIPKVLEFYSLAPDWAKEIIVEAFGEALDKIDLALQKTKNVYTNLYILSNHTLKT